MSPLCVACPSVRSCIRVGRKVLSPLQGAARDGSKPAFPLHFILRFRYAPGTSETSTGSLHSYPHGRQRRSYTGMTGGPLHPCRLPIAASPTPCRRQAATVGLLPRNGS